MPAFETVRRALRGTDRAESPGLPIGEAMHPVTLFAIALLVVNDWVLKGAFGPSFVTGKLSDLAGLAFAPVVLSAAIGLVLQLLAMLGARVDPSLSRRRLFACIVATGTGFAAVKLSPALAAHVAELLGHLGRRAAFYEDWTDLLTLPAVLVALWIGRDELRRVPLGRAAAIHRTGQPAASALADVRWAGRDTSELARAIDAWDVSVIDQQLASPRERIVRPVT